MKTKALQEWVLMGETFTNKISYNLNKILKIPCQGTKRKNKALDQVLTQKQEKKEGTNHRTPPLQVVK